MESVFSLAREKMEKTISSLKYDFNGIRAGRANAAVLDKIQVDYYGCPTPINQMANISVVDARMLQISIYDQTQLHPMRKALSEANLGVNISDDGKVIRLAFPALTEERRKELAKSLRTVLENAKVAMRNARRDAIDDIKDLKKENILNEDDASFQEKEVQKKLDAYIAKLDELYAAKEKEIMEI